MTKEKKLWIFHHYATPPTINGFTRPYDIGKFLKKEGYDIKVFSSSFLHFSEKNLIEDSALYKINNESEIPFVFVKTITGKGNGIMRILNMITYYLNIFRVTRKFTKNNIIPDIILASSPHPLTLVAGIQIAKKLNIPIITEIRDFWPEVFFMGGKLKEDSLIGKLLLKAEYWIYRKSDALIFLKEGDFEYITDKKWDLNQGGKIDLKKIHYINNGVDIQEFEKQILKWDYKDTDLHNDKFNIVYTGAIRIVNNIDKILDAAKELVSYNDIQFLIYGEGNQLEKLKERVKNEKINNVEFKGYVDKKYIPSILSKSSVNILNYSQTKYNWSRGNSSNKLFEYMASGKPIISTIRMGYSPIEKYNCGISLQNNTPRELAETILKIKNMTDREYLTLCQNSKNAARNFDYSLLAQKMKNVLAELLHEKE